jgi:hypothetical protein
MMNGQPCPEVMKHTLCPTGYVDFMEWAERKGRTHRQVQCPGCGLFKVWVPKKRRKRRQPKGGSRG